MKQYDKFFEPVTDLSGKGFFSDKFLTGKLTYTKKKEDKTCKFIHKSQLEEKEGKISHFGEGQVEGECKHGKTNFTFSNAKFAIDSFYKGEMGLCNETQPFNAGVKYEIPFSDPNKQLFGLYYKLNSLHIKTDKCFNYSTQLKAETKKESYKTPTLEWQNLFKFKTFYGGCRTKCNTSLAPKFFAECEKMLGFQNENFQAYAKYLCKEMKCKDGVATLGLYATKTCTKKNVKCEVGGEGSLDLSKRGESENVFAKMFSGNLCAKLTGDDHGLQFKFDHNFVLSTSLFVKPMSQLKLTVSDSFNPVNIFKDAANIKYRYGFSAEWDI